MLGGISQRGIRSNMNHADVFFLMKLARISMIMRSLVVFADLFAMQLRTIESNSEAASFLHIVCRMTRVGEL